MVLKMSGIIQIATNCYGYYLSANLSAANFNQEGTSIFYCK